MKKLIIIFVLLSLAACAPLKRDQRNYRNIDNWSYHMNQLQWQGFKADIYNHHHSYKK